MVLKPFYTDGLDRLRSKDQLDLLDSIDNLRSQGISHYVSLPQIIVCGDQSSGKSSVLEALSGVSFPIKSNLCTRFPTELVLRKTTHASVKVSIVPDHSRSESERHALSSFHQNLDGFEGLSTLIEEAKSAMGISPHGRAFSRDLLRVEVSGPDRPHLTIVDLPGLIHSETKQQSAFDVELVQDLVKSYMVEGRCIILAVVSAKNDYANQIVLKLARAADKMGVRTLEVITKPDTLIEGSVSEGMYISLARNQDVEFRLGWHVLKNMDSEKGQSSLDVRDTEEARFFSGGVWKDLSRSLVGVGTLRDRLSKVLLGQIATELPSLIDEIEVKINACDNRLDKLGEPRATMAEQRLYLLHISQVLQSLVKAAVDGTYNDLFFGDAKTDLGYQKRLRALVQNLNQDFADQISKRGHSRQIVETTSAAKTIPRSVTLITRDEFLDHIEHLMKRTKGRELPRTFNPMIVADLFLEQSAPWEEIARSQIGKVWRAAKEFLGHVTSQVADEATSKALFLKIFEPALNQLLTALNEKTGEILAPHQKSHPITYNHHFTETLQKVRNERSKDNFSKILKNFFHVTSIESGVYVSQQINLSQLLSELVLRTEPDMNRFACSEALNCMEAYYKVALKRFINDISVEVIETVLVSKLGNIFSPVGVTAMDKELVTRIAGESEENRVLREELMKQLDVLRKGSDTCKRFVGMRLFDSEEISDQSDTQPDSQDEQESTSPASDKHDTPLEIIKPIYFDHSVPEIAEDIPCIIPAIASPEVFGFSSNYLDRLKNKKNKKSKVLQSRAVFEEADGT